jgi:hypothetical protein
MKTETNGKGNCGMACMIHDDALEFRVEGLGCSGLHD